ncbi:ABC transporter substrate-binding protein [Myroides injenensis]|uniref:ABC transporter substrate-binding protein n=1 Tax=Myroides injenensis TaxID=1183151 RepID=UPI000289D894|nr:ABC transporter substrate-binding protein [Myroides injenensis]
MKNKGYYILSVMLLFVVFSCKKTTEKTQETVSKGVNLVEYAKGFSMYDYSDFTIVKITQPWANSTKEYDYVLYKNESTLPDSLRNYTAIKVPIQNIVVTSTTHLPSIELLDEVKSLIGFPGLDYVSTPVIREQIANKNIKELGQNDNLNTELILDLHPNVIVAFAMDDKNTPLHTLEKSGIPVVYNGDWIEQSPLGKAEWIKLFGALYDKKEKAERLFNQIADDYNEVLTLVENTKDKPTILSGVMYQDVWYMPQGESWAAVYFRDAVSDYIWKDTSGTGSLALSFEAVYDKGKDADFWINPGHYESLKQLKEANEHYANFTAFKKGNVYSFAPTKGETGGTVFYELGPTRPDLVLKDIVSILHPELLPNYERVFYQQLQ